ncbi:MAG: aquaporin, partial [Rhodospirillaceae bacterium]
VIMGATDNRAPAGFAPIAIGLALTLIHLISIPVTNTSVNPARSTGPALLVVGWALAQLWLAHSGEGDQPFRLKVITDSGDRDHADHGQRSPA